MELKRLTSQIGKELFFRFQLKTMLSLRCSPYLVRFSSTWVDIGAQMKSLNDQQQYGKAVQLFEKNREKSPSPLMISQVLKALIHSKQYERGKLLHRHLSPFHLNNQFTRTNLIRLYGKTTQPYRFLHFP